MTYENLFKKKIYSKMRKGIFFTIDSLLAAGIIIVSILAFSNFYSAEQQKANVN